MAAKKTAKKLSKKGAKKPAKKPASRKDRFTWTDSDVKWLSPPIKK